MSKIFYSLPLLHLLTLPLLPVTTQALFLSPSFYFPILQAVHSFDAQAEGEFSLSVVVHSLVSYILNLVIEIWTVLLNGE